MSDRYNNRVDADRDDEEPVDSNMNTDDDTGSSISSADDENVPARGKVGEAMRRDWEQTKADVGLGGRDLDQDVPDTVGQAAGKRPIPPANLPNIKVEDDEKDEDEDTYSSTSTARDADRSY